MAHFAIGFIFGCAFGLVVFSLLAKYIHALIGIDPRE